MISVVIPSYNEGENLRENISELIDRLTEEAPEESFEVVVVDDHSTDETPSILSALNRQDERIRYLRLSKNGGSHTAIRAGLSRARGKCAIVVSADGQDNPECIGEMIREWQGGAHIVWALRERRDEPWLYRTFSRLFYWLLRSFNRSTNEDIDLSRADFYLLDRRVIEVINNIKERNSSLFGLIAWLGYKQSAVEYKRRPRRSGRSKWSLQSRLKLATDWIIGFSGLPLRLTTYLGIAVSTLGLAYAVFIFVYALIGNPIEGWASLMIVVLLLSGVMLLSIGVSGEYLWRVLDETRGRPPFFVENESDEER